MSPFRYAPVDMTRRGGIITARKRVRCNIKHSCKIRSSQRFALLRSEVIKFSNLHSVVQCYVMYISFPVCLVVLKSELMKSNPAYNLTIAITLSRRRLSRLFRRQD